MGEKIQFERRIYMKRIVSLATMFLALTISTGALDRSGVAHATTYGGGQVSFGFFYSSLGPHGEWIEAEPGFYVWRPLHVSYGWRPYLHGRWVWTSYGWYWVSYEPFGWIVFHYGRWYYDDFYGWVWVPDYVWGPAWVEWRYNDDYIGWAPLPPYATFNISIGIRFTRAWRAPVHYWTFIPCRYITHHRYVDYVVPVERTRRLFGTTRTSTYYSYEDGRVINRGIDVRFVERRANTRIRPVDIVETRERGVERVVQDNGLERIEVYRPSRDETQKEVPSRIEARRPDRRLSLDTESIERDSRRGTIKRDETYRRDREAQPDRQMYRPSETREERDVRRAPVPERRSDGQREGEVRHAPERRPQHEPQIQKNEERRRTAEPERRSEPHIERRSPESRPAPSQQDQERQPRPERSERPR